VFVGSDDRLSHIRCERAWRVGTTTPRLHSFAFTWITIPSSCIISQFDNKASFFLSCDLLGNANLSAKEVGLWFHKTFSNTSVGDKKSEERFAHLIAAFDVDHDGSFDDAELKEMFDVYDEHPDASDELKVLGGDDHDTVWIIVGLLGLAGVSTIFLLYSEAFKTA